MSADVRGVPSPPAMLRQVQTRLAFDTRGRGLLEITRPVADWTSEGVVLHAESLAAQAGHRARLLPWLVVPLWLAAAALVAIAMALAMGR